MRWRLTLLVAATTSAVVLAFLIPLALLLRSLAAERSIARATSEGQNLSVFAATSDRDEIADDLAHRSSKRLGRVTVFLPQGAPLGVDTDVPLLESQTGQLQAFTDRRDGRAIVYSPTLSSTGVDANGAPTTGVTVVRTQLGPAELSMGVARATWILAGLGAGMLLLSIGAADALARRVSRPIRDLAEAADSLHEGQLENRVPERGPPEVLAMGRALNRLAARIQQLLISERESVADLSHRLRTPVTALRLDAESIADPEMAARLDTHVAHLERTVDAVLRDVRRPVRSTSAARCDVGAVVGERVTFWSALADEQNRSLRTRLPTVPTWAKIDTVDLTDVVDVLIDNVFAHTEDGVPLEVSVLQTPAGEVMLVVEDGGPGLPGADVVTRGLSLVGSSGLGLDIVRRAAIASGGRLELGRSQLGGAKIRVVLGAAERRDAGGDWKRARPGRRSRGPLGLRRPLGRPSVHP
jgi:signal transduction histidine kinase